MKKFKGLAQEYSTVEILDALKMGDYLKVGGKVWIFCTSSSRSQYDGSHKTYGFIYSDKMSGYEGYPTFYTTDELEKRGIDGVHYGVLRGAQIYRLKEVQDD